MVDAQPNVRLCSTVHSVTGQKQVCFLNAAAGAFLRFDIFVQNSLKKIHSKGLLFNLALSPMKSKGQAFLFQLAFTVENSIAEINN
jgi:hypothetical protein